MTHAYEVRLLNHSGAMIAVFDHWSRLDYTQRVNASGDCRFEMSGLDSRVDLFTHDTILEIHRTDLDRGVPKYVDGRYFHLTPQRYMTQRGEERFVSYGRGMTDLVRRRAIAYDAGTTYTDKSGPADNVAKAYVRENAGAAATSPPRDADGVTSGLVVVADSSLGPSWEGSRTRRGLLDVLQEISSASSVDFGVEYTGVSGAVAFEFRTAYPHWGNDRSIGNSAGNVPVIFAVGFGNMNIPQYSESRTEEQNRIYVLGQGAEDQRTVEIVEDVTLQDDSPWALAEGTYNASQEDDVSGLVSAGQAALQERRPRKSFTFDVMQTWKTIYGHDYRLGDIVTAQYRSVQVNRKIVAVTVSVHGGVEEIKLELAEVQG